MNLTTYTEKQENKNRSMAESVSQIQDNSEAAAHFVDNRADAIQMRDLQGSVKRSAATRHLSQMQVMADACAGQHSLIQRKQGSEVLSDGVNLNADVIQAVFSQAADAGIQESHHGGVKSQYDTALNLVELHIDVGANADGNMMQDFLLALWEARTAITAGQVRDAEVAGGVFMRPGGSQVLKNTMELLGESIGQGNQLIAARNANAVRKKADQPMWVDPSGDDAHDNIIDQTVVAEHLAYRNSMIGVDGIEMKPIGGGTSGGSEDMLADMVGAADERTLYNDALIGLSPFMSIAITINLAVVNQVIGMIEAKVGFFKRQLLKIKYAKDG
ncbi:MAG: hypothetical protein COB33_015255 [Thiotrichaceae bacterium]|nr:hypothetical protein [Thiotrichaceae bacterium]PCI10901.1 MAG: hypothetical protein COB71_12395 [Thiotrichales bacterium]PCI13372.1 MAG: hypothetical protein COB71_06290 [Thiotrichales bacterium]